MRKGSPVCGCLLLVWINEGSLSVRRRLKADRHRLVYDHGIRRDLAVHGQHTDSPGGGFPQSLSERGVSLVIWRETAHPLHLNNKQHIGLISFFQGFDQAVKMLHAPLRRGVGKTGNAIFLQGYALDLHKSFCSGAVWIFRRKRQVKAGIPVGDLPP